MDNRYRIAILSVLAGVSVFWTFPVASESGEESAVLQANAAFYQAFVRGDSQKMDSLWSQHSSVAVIHPTWPSISGREAVMQSWRHLMVAPRDLEIAEARAFVADDSAFVICYEILDGTTVLVATNIFTRENDAWKLVHHHAGAARYEPTTGISI